MGEYLKHGKPMHLKYCGTAKPDRFLLETAYRFVTEFLDPVGNINLKHPTKIRAPGNKVTAKRSRDGAGQMWIKLFSAYEGDECLVYPFATAANPRGGVTFNFKRMTAHRAMCLMVNKLPTEPKMMALHRCGNGHLGCVTPKHLYWGTHSDNVKDAHRHTAEGKPECVSASPAHRHLRAA